MNSTPPSANIQFINQDFTVNELNHPLWATADVQTTQNYWSGELAPATEHFETRLLWSQNSLYVRFEAQQHQPLNVSAQPQLAKKTMALWERDVCELFLAPDPAQSETYFEFEVAPTGEWIDLKIQHALVGGERQRITDWDFKSGMQTAASAQENVVVMAFKVDWDNLQIKPNKGDVFLGNIFRAMGQEPNRSYLAWSPTKTQEPCFHVPEQFKKLVLC